MQNKAKTKRKHCWCESLDFHPRRIKRKERQTTRSGIHAPTLWRMCITRLLSLSISAWVFFSPRKRSGRDKTAESIQYQWFKRLLNRTTFHQLPTLIKTPWIHIQRAHHCIFSARSLLPFHSKSLKIIKYSKELPTFASQDKAKFMLLSATEETLHRVTVCVSRCEFYTLLSRMIPSEMFQHLFSECYADYHANSWTSARESVQTLSVCLLFVQRNADTAA